MTVDPTIRLVGVEDARALVDAGDRIVLDVRTPEEFADGHLSGAVHIDVREPSFPHDVDRLDRSGRYLVHCRTTNRATTAARIMTEMGFRDVLVMDGGVTAWEGAGFPVER